MAILGLNVSGLHGSACLIVDGEIKYAITEERLSRIKNDKSFPLKSIEYCCKAAKVEKSEITDVFVGWNPKFNLTKSDNSLDDAMQNRGKMAYLALNELSTIFKGEDIEIKEQIRSFDASWDIHFVNHHAAHIAGSFFQSGFVEADFIVADGFGEVTTGMMGEINPHNIKVMSEFRTPHSLGGFYSTFTDFLGFKPNSDEWKVMALASLGDSDVYYEDVKSLISVTDLAFELDLSYFEHFLFFTPHYYSKKFIELFGDPVIDNNLSQKYYDLVASLQRVGEEVVIELLNNLHKKNSTDNLVVSGGFFMNSVLNGKILDNTNYKNIYIGGFPDDSGISIGSALYGNYYINKEPFVIDKVSKANYFGKIYDDSDILDTLTKRKIKFEKIENIEKVTAKLIRDFNIVAWFQGGSEFGQRALGNRSILADPTNVKVKDLVNSSIKYREGFRPFAPSVLSSEQSIYFTISNKQTSYFMEKVFKFKPEYEDIFPGVYHYDGTGRLQTVDKEVNNKYWILINEFKKLSGYGVLLNTSFNINGMPLVETPGDAIDCFYQSGIDALVLNNYLIKK